MPNLKLKLQKIHPELDRLQDKFCFQDKKKIKVVPLKILNFNFVSTLQKMHLMWPVML